MVDDGKVARTAQHLHGLLRERTQLTPLADLRPADLAEAYAVQERLQDLLAPARGAIVGYKIAITTPKPP